MKSIINKHVLVFAVFAAALISIPAIGLSLESIGDDQVLVEYYHDPTCQQCNIAKPFIVELAESYGEQVVLVTHDLITPDDFSSMFSLGIYNTPALLIEKQVALVYGNDFGDDIDEMVDIISTTIDGFLSRESPLTVYRTVEPGTVATGGTINVTVTLMNTGTGELSNITSLDEHIDGTVLVSGTAEWSGQLAPAENITYVYTLRVDLSEGSYELPATDVIYMENGIHRTAGGYNTTIAISPELSPVVVFGAGFLAGFNPCLLAILAFIASVSLSTSGKRRDVILLVIVFSLGIFVVYLLSGLGLLYVVESAPGIQSMITTVLVIAIGFLALWHIADTYYIASRDKTTFYTPKSIGRLLKNVTKARNLPIIFALGALFSLIKAPCVGAVYFAVLDLIIKQGQLASGFMYLAFYNIGVILPVIVLGVGIAIGLPPDRVEEFRLKRRALTRFITGVTLLLVALLLALPSFWAPLLLGTLGFALAFTPEVMNTLRTNTSSKLVFAAGIVLIAAAIIWVLLA